MYVHFCRSEIDADNIIRERKLRTSSWQGREDRIFAVDLDETVENGRVQLGGRIWGVLFTTPEAEVSNNFKNEVYWFEQREFRDEDGGYLPLDMAVKLDLDGVKDVRGLLNAVSPEWGEPDDPKYW